MVAGMGYHAPVYRPTFHAWQCVGAAHRRAVALRAAWKIPPHTAMLGNTRSLPTLHYHTYAHLLLPPSSLLRYLAPVPTTACRSPLMNRQSLLTEGDR